MSNVASLAKDSVKGLGPAAALVTALPSAVFVLGTYGIVASRLYPWSETFRKPDGSEVARGFPSIVAESKELGVTGGVLAFLAVLIISVLLRPLQIALVQYLEGYSSRRGPGIREHFAVELHLRRRSYHVTRQEPNLSSPDSPDFAEVARYARRVLIAQRMKERAHLIISSYPLSPKHVMPTSLGNVLRRAETTAGERYGLNTVVTYPRLYPHLSARLDAELGNHLDIIDTACTIAVVLVGLGAISAPLVGRGGWALVPVVLLALAAVAYRGARRAALRYSVQLQTAYDLHRFDMMEAMHLEIPKTTQREREVNRQLSKFLSGYPAGELKRPTWTTYHHPPLPPTTQVDVGQLSQQEKPEDGPESREPDQPASKASANAAYPPGNDLPPAMSAE